MRQVSVSSACSLVGGHPSGEWVVRIIYLSWFYVQGNSCEALIPKDSRRETHKGRGSCLRWPVRCLSAVCSPGGGVLTLISVPLCVRSGSVSARPFGMVYLVSGLVFGVFSGWEGLA